MKIPPPVVWKGMVTKVSKFKGKLPAIEQTLKICRQPKHMTSDFWAVQK